MRKRRILIYLVVFLRKYNVVNVVNPAPFLESICIYTLFLFPKFFLGLTPHVVIFLKQGQYLPHLPQYIYSISYNYYIILL